MHTHAPDGLEQYAKLLHLQLSMLLRHTPKHPIMYWCCYDLADDRTTRVLEHAWWSAFANPLVSIIPHGTTKARLFRRAILRNEIASNLDTTALAVWFGDVDTVWGPGALDAVSELAMAGKLPEISTPEKYYLNKTHAHGDAIIARTHGAPPFDEPEPLDQADFIQVKNDVVIGGQMILRADIARQGYLDGNRKWQKEADPARGFACFRCDVGYKKSQKALGRQWARIKVPNVYRIRHAKSSMNPDGLPEKFRLGNNPA